MTYDVVWHRRRVQWRRHIERAPWVVEAILTERILRDGKPQLRIVCRIASIAEECVNDTAARDLFWQNAGRKLGKMSRLAPRDLWHVEKLLAARVPKAAPAPTVRPGANPGSRSEREDQQDA